MLIGIFHICQYMNCFFIFFFSELLFHLFFFPVVLSFSYWCVTKTSLNSRTSRSLKIFLVLWSEPIGTWKMTRDTNKSQPTIFLLCHPLLSVPKMLLQLHSVLLCYSLRKQTRTRGYALFICIISHCDGPPLHILYALPISFHHRTVILHFLSVYKEQFLVCQFLELLNNSSCFGMKSF